MTETAIKKRIMEALARRGGFFYRAGAGAYSKAGIADIIGVYRGRFVAIEAKTPAAYKKVNAGATKNQADFLDRVCMHGGFARVACTVAQVEQFIDEIDEELNT